MLCDCDYQKDYEILAGHFMNVTCPICNEETMLKFSESKHKKTILKMIKEGREI